MNLFTEHLMFQNEDALEPGARLILRAQPVARFRPESLVLARDIAEYVAIESLLIAGAEQLTRSIPASTERPGIFGIVAGHFSQDPSTRGYLCLPLVNIDEQVELHLRNCWRETIRPRIFLQKTSREDRPYLLAHEYGVWGALEGVYRR